MSGFELVAQGPPMDWFEAIWVGGATGVLVLVLWALIGPKRWIVPGWVYRAVESEKNEWKTLALRGTDLADRSSRGQEAGVEAARTAVAALEAIRLKDRLDAEADVVRRSDEE